MSQLMRLWFMCTYHIGNQRRLSRTYASAQSRESLRCSLKWSMEVDEESDQTSDLAPLKNDFTEDGKYHNLMTWLKWHFTVHSLQNHPCIVLTWLKYCWKRCRSMTSFIHWSYDSSCWWNTTAVSTREFCTSHLSSATLENCVNHGPARSKLP